MTFVSCFLFISSFHRLSSPLCSLTVESGGFIIMIRHAIRRPLSNATCVTNIGRRYAHAPSVFNWEDPLDSASLFTEEEIAIQESAHAYCQERMLPRVLGSQKPVNLQSCSLSAFLRQRPTGTSNMTGRSWKKWASLGSLERQ